MLRSARNDLASVPSELCPKSLRGASPPKAEERRSNLVRSLFQDAKSGLFDTPRWSGPPVMTKSGADTLVCLVSQQVRVKNPTIRTLPSASHSWWATDGSRPGGEGFGGPELGLGGGDFGKLKKTEKKLKKSRVGRRVFDMKMTPRFRSETVGGETGPSGRKPWPGLPLSLPS